MENHQGGTIALEVYLIAFLWKIAIACILKDYIILIRTDGIAYKLPIA